MWAKNATWVGLEEIALLIFSSLICWLLLRLSKTVPRFAGAREHISAVQASHTRPTPRIGGVAIFGTLLASLFFVPFEISAAYCKFLLSTCFLFSIGLVEDMGFGVAPRWRLMAAFTASLLVIILLDVWLPRVGIPWLDIGLAYWSIGVPVTLLLTATISNGFNLIDGVNGLAGFTGLASAISMACIADAAGYVIMVQLAMSLAAAVAGFLLWNYPFGRIFLGDAGAYTLGFVLSWFAIAILLNAETVSPWALLLTLFWPVADTLLAVWRRFQRRSPTMAPDRLHVHQLVMRSLEIHILGRRRRHIANPLSTLVLSPFVVFPPITGVVLWDDNRSAFIATIILTFMFFGAYMLAFSVLKHVPRCRIEDRANLSGGEVANLPSRFRAPGMRRQDRSNGKRTHPVN